MSLVAKLLSACGGAEKLYVDDVFQTTLINGDGTAQTITNRIDLSGKGGLVWEKPRSVANDHYLTTGSGNFLRSNTTGAQSNTGSITYTFNSTGYVANSWVTGVTVASWTFRKAPKFFDVVTYTGDGVAGRQIPHALGIAPGMVIVKCTSAVDNWYVKHVAGGANNVLLIDSTTAAYSDSSTFGVGFSFNTSTFQVSGAGANENGKTYVAYLFAHDPSADGIIKCGSFTTDGSGNATVNHGWSAGVQFATIKSSSTTGDWEMYDTARTAGWSGSDARLRSNLSSAEDAVTRLSASGTSVSFTGLSASSTYICVFVVSPT